ncbi:Winged helix-turn-helix DNA-binding domain [Plasmopara halstedii]|uniref:Winged helix-turn-helix DNA-binding domain n=1 Tax=Plasmopara halstedii TaxID=4781 RepID=A0A0P1AAD7_PLAHL|nr:Winged helix-turn-helix DNA-binding domain [Plasmopara halstedii]CEG37369.1 Winged helix-turn-helix DNA-binding domain [Plasmopara halstedii]|eukprot:XP_024573738.1 Winged helix-turn-helix DNA-binding domain [Plasmopara halstedii]
MPDYPVNVSRSSTFNVPHPIHRDPPVSCYQQSALDITFASAKPTNYLCPMASPTMSHSGTCKPPVVSPFKRTRKSRIVFDFSTEEMAKYFHMSQREAAQQLGVATVTIKRNCRRLGIVWPYRLMKSKNRVIKCSTILREDIQRIRHTRSLGHAEAGRSHSMHDPRRLLDACNDEVAAKAITLLSHSHIELTQAGRAFARLPLDCVPPLE